MKRPSLKEVKESLKRLTMAGSLETDGIRWGDQERRSDLFAEVGS
jgi:hypothetical protein